MYFLGNLVSMATDYPPDVKGRWLCESFVLWLTSSLLYCHCQRALFNCDNGNMTRLVDYCAGNAAF